MALIKNLRENYLQSQLLESDLPDHPLDLFGNWFKLAQNHPEKEPNAMVLSTVNKLGNPRSRVVLLKDYSNNGFTFFTNYSSNKGQEILNNPNISLCFAWLGIEKQVRVEGVAQRISRKESVEYFESRPEGSRLGAIASDQSQPIAGREDLDQKLENLKKINDIETPINWGGYLIKPNLIEFWQGRPNRLHDRIEYKLIKNKWVYQRLQP